MSFLLALYHSPMVKKAVMAVTGIILFGFVFMHMVGNLKLYQGMVDGEPKINIYAEGLRDLGAPILGHGEALWIARGVLLAAVVLHMLSAFQLARLSRRARPVDYREVRHQASTYASRTMRWGGVIILLFVVYHLLHLTLGGVHPEFRQGDVYHNVIRGFSNVFVSGFYILAQICLAMHLYHGVWSLTQTLGLGGGELHAFRKRFAAGFAALVAIGNISFPLAVLTGLIQ